MVIGVKTVDIQRRAYASSSREVKSQSTKGFNVANRGTINGTPSAAVSPGSRGFVSLCETVDRVLLESYKARRIDDCPSKTKETMLQ